MIYSSKSSNPSINKVVAHNLSCCVSLHDVKEQKTYHNSRSRSNTEIVHFIKKTEYCWTETFLRKTTMNNGKSVFSHIKL